MRLPDANGRWLIAQITTTGSISGQMNYRVFPLGVGANQMNASVAFDGTGTFGGGEQRGHQVALMIQLATMTRCTSDDGSCT